MHVTMDTNSSGISKYILCFIFFSLCQGIPITTKDFITKYPCLEYNICECSEGIHNPPDSGTVTIDCRERNLTRVPALVDLVPNKYYRLWLRDNYIQVINSHDFNSNLIKEIDIGGYNQIRYIADKSLKLTSRFLQKLTLNITLLNVYKLRFLHSVPTLYELTIEGNNKLSKIPRRLFPGYKLKTLRMLSLMHCGIEKIAWGAFLGISNVKELHLSHNYLKTVPTSALRGLKHLSKLDLSFNQLKVLDGQSFAELFKLSEIDLTGNYLKEMSEMPADVFYYQEKTLQKLILSKTFINTIPTQSIQNLQQLRFLNISYNQIYELNSTQPFLGLSLRVLDISGNGFPLEETLLDGLEGTLFRLILRDLNITDLPYPLLMKLSRLYELDISGNTMSYLPDYFNEGISARHFILRHMNIKNISPKAFIKPSEIAELSIDAESNLINNLDFVKYSPPCTFHYLNLMENPINCDCVVYELIVDRAIRISGTCASIKRHQYGLSFTSENLQKILQHECSPETFTSHCTNEYAQRQARQKSSSSSSLKNNIILVPLIIHIIHPITSFL